MLSDSDHVGENKPNREAQKESTNKTGEPNTNASTSPAAPTLEPTANRYTITCNTEKSRWDKFKEGAEVVGIVVLIVYAIYTIKMYYANKEAADAAKKAADIAADALQSSNESFAKTLSQMKDQTKQQSIAAQAAKSQAALAQKSLDATIASFNGDQRAWVGLQSWQCQGCSKEDYIIKVGKVTAIITNTGRTPALRMDIHGAYSVSQKTSVEEPIPDIDTFFSGPTIFFSGAGGPATRAKMIQQMASQEVLAPSGIRVLTVIPAIEVGSKGAERPDFDHRILGMIRITYYVAGESDKHTTTFCLFNEFGMKADFALCGNNQSMN
jgi:hypothetical protein